ncbi:WG repeat-containing protein [Psychrobacter sp. BF1]|uniref:WG repeat-containing protein n=1 Tax=Psychrobacter sp. BF1 TaxID=2821147 RepID=UPI001C4E0676|nr:WG repeat-containing protein [Psychrobacter sp. BF1]
MDMLIKKLIDSFYANVLPISVFCLTVVASVLITTSAQATINCAGYLPNSYFERIDDDSKFAGKSAQVGLLNDQSNWVIAQQYDELQPLNACTGQPLYLQAISTKAFTSKMQRQTALLDQNASVIIPFAANQNIEVFNSRDSSTLFLRSDLIEGSTATGMTEDIKNNIVSAQIIDAKGKVILLSESAIVKLLYHQLYAYKQDGKFGLIDDRANMVLAPQFDSYRDEGNKVWVEKQGKMFDLATLIELD